MCVGRFKKIEKKFTKKSCFLFKSILRKVMEYIAKKKRRSIKKKRITKQRCRRSILKQRFNYKDDYLIESLCHSLKITVKQLEDYEKVLGKYWQSNKKLMTYDNGLTKELQKIVDARYEELMDDLRKKHPDVHKMMMVELDSFNLYPVRRNEKKLKRT